MAGAGHNSGFARDVLKTFISRIERMEEEKAALLAGIKEIYAEAKGTGFDTKVLRRVIALRKMDKADRQEMEALVDLYMNAIGQDDDDLVG